MGYIAGIGGANMDIHGKADHRIIMRDSNPGTLHASLGGVCRNICENLVRLGSDVKLVTVVGDDENGKGILRGCEPEVPKSLMPKDLPNSVTHTVTYSLLDKNGHMNNTRYLDWVSDLLPAAFHKSHCPAEIVLCYLSEALEGQHISLCYGLSEAGELTVDAHRASTSVCAKTERVFSAQVRYL